MSLLTIIIVFVVVGLVLWLVTSYIPMDARIKNVLVIVVLILLVLWVLQGVFGGFPDIRIGG
jgi:cytosine/uracil/thiamine/allantoin permease